MDGENPVYGLMKRCTGASMRDGVPFFMKTTERGRRYCDLLEEFSTQFVEGEHPKGACECMNPKIIVPVRAELLKKNIGHPACMYKPEGEPVLGDYHTHTRISDGATTPDENVQGGIDAGLEEIAITAHGLTKKLITGKGIVIHQNPGKPGEGQTPIVDYLTVMEYLKGKYEGTIRVLAGVEIDGRHDDNPHLENLNYGALNLLDFALFENITRDMLPWFLEARKKLDIPVGLAHTYFNIAFKDITPEALAIVLAENDIFVEIGHFSFDFDKYAAAMRKHGVKFTTASDAHHADMVGFTVREKLAEMAKHGLEQQKF